MYIDRITCYKGIILATWDFVNLRTLNIQS